MKPLVVDFETYYDKEYSLSKMPTVQYIRDERFKILGVAVRHENGGRYLSEEEFAARAARTDWNDVLFIAHNAQFDSAILFEKFGFKPRKSFCTMFAARYLIAQGKLPATLKTSLKALAPLVGKEKGDLDASAAAGKLDEYAMLDADICWDLYESFYPQVPEEERDYISMHVEMAANPILELDTKQLREAASADDSVAEMFGAVRKDDLFTEMLSALGVQMEYKTTEKGNTKPALGKKDPFMKSLLKHENETVRFLADIRLKSKATNERNKSQRFLDVGSPLPVPLIYYGAHTGRSSGTDKLNLQNMKRGGAARTSVRAPEGYKLVIVDSSQIEVRVNAWLAGETELLETFRLGRDPYAVFACRYLYPQDYDAFMAKLGAGDKTAKGQRQVAKSAVLGLGFGMYAGGFQAYCEAMGVSLDGIDPEAVVSVYRRAHPAIAASWKRNEQTILSTGQLALPSGRVLTYPDLSRDGRDATFSPHAIFSKLASGEKKKIWGGLATENIVQATARDLVFEQVRLLWSYGVATLALMVHDEAVFVVKDDLVETFRDAAKAAFSWTPAWATGIPVEGQAAYSQEYSK